MKQFVFGLDDHRKATLTQTLAATAGGAAASYALLIVLSDHSTRSTQANRVFSDGRGENAASEQGF